MGVLCGQDEGFRCKADEMTNVKRHEPVDGKVIAGRSDQLKYLTF